MTVKKFEPKSPAGARVRGRGRVGGRVVITTTVAKSTAEFFEKNPMYVVGRALDDWVEKKAGVDEEETAKRVVDQIAKLALGDCKCGRLILPPNKAVKFTHCPGCQQVPTACGCQPTAALRKKWLIEWTQARQVAGIQTSMADIEAKSSEFELAYTNPPKK